MKIFASIILACLTLAACTGGKDGQSGCGKPAPKPAAASCKGVYQGRVDPPGHAMRVAARNRQLADGGTLGGGVDGGMYLQGAFDFETDAACKITKGEIILHGHRIALSGGVQKGAIAIQFDGGYGAGKVSGGAIKGSVHEGGGRSWVYGVMVGKFIPSGKP